jgi:hypothetical protein
MRTRTTGLSALSSKNSSKRTKKSTICLGESKRQCENENCFPHRKKWRRLEQLQRRAREQLTVGAVNDHSRTREEKERGGPTGIGDGDCIYTALGSGMIYINNKDPAPRVSESGRVPS